MKEIIDLRKKEAEPVHSPEISGTIHPHQQTVHKPAAIAIATSLVLIGMAYLYFQKNILTAIFFFLIATIILVFTFKKKLAIPWEINKHGIAIDTSFFPYQELKSFWIEYQPQYIQELSLQSKKWYHGYFKIPIDGKNPLKIREALLEFLPEERHEDSLVETISRKLGI